MGLGFPRKAGSPPQPRSWPTPHQSWGLAALLPVPTLPPMKRPRPSSSFRRISCGSMDVAQTLPPSHPQCTPRWLSHAPSTRQPPATRFQVLLIVPA